jgi:hypothetical protein
MKERRPRLTAAPSDRVRWSVLMVLPPRGRIVATRDHSTPSPDDRLGKGDQNPPRCDIGESTSSSIRTCGGDASTNIAARATSSGVSMAARSAASGTVGRSARKSLSIVPGQRCVARIALRAESVHARQDETGTPVARGGGGTTRWATSFGLRNGAEDEEQENEAHAPELHRQGPEL